MCKKPKSKKKTDYNTHDPDFSKGKSVLKHWGTWVGSKEEYYKIIKAIRKSRSDAEF